MARSRIGRPRAKVSKGRRPPKASEALLAARRADGGASFADERPERGKSPAGGCRANNPGCHSGARRGPLAYGSRHARIATPHLGNSADRVPRAGFRLTQGEPMFWTRVTDSRRRLK